MIEILRLQRRKSSRNFKIETNVRYRFDILTGKLLDRQTNILISCDECIAQREKTPTPKEN